MVQQPLDLAPGTISQWAVLKPGHSAHLSNKSRTKWRRLSKLDDLEFHGPASQHRRRIYHTVLNLTDQTIQRRHEQADKSLLYLVCSQWRAYHRLLRTLRPPKRPLGFRMGASPGVEEAETE